MASSSCPRSDKPRNERSRSEGRAKTAVVAGVYGPSQPDAQLRILLGDAVQGVLHPPLNGGPGAVDGGVGALGAAPAPGRTRELARNRLQLVPQALGPSGVAACLRVVRPIPQFLQSGTVRAERLAVEELARIASVGLHRPGQ